jgi:hypothetical protein
MLRGYCIIVQVMFNKDKSLWQEVPEIVLQGVRGHSLHPYFWLELLFFCHPADGDAPAFGHVDAGGRYIPVSYHKLLACMNQAVQAAGMDPAAFAGWHIIPCAVGVPFGPSNVGFIPCLSASGGRGTVMLGCFMLV